MSAELEQARRAEPAWDEVRERRVLARVLAHKNDGARRRARARVAIGAGVVAIAAGVALAWMVRDPQAPIVAEAPAEVVAPAVSTGRIALRDGSEVELGDDARVEIEVQGPVEVRIAQHAGRARYVVSHRPERAFVVVAGDVEVVVRGTRFVVQVAPPWAEVEVEEGRVEVRRAGEVRALSIGESMRVPLVDPEIEPEAPAETVTEREAETERPATRRRERAGEPEIAIETLLGQADEARRAGRLDDAARALRAAISQHREDPRVATALYTLGRVERSRGRDGAAAEAFESAYERDPGAILAEDALAESAVSWAAAGRRDRARSAAQRYLGRHPAGEYVDRVRHLAE